MELPFVALIDIVGRDRARLPVDRLERRQSRLPSLDSRLLRAGDAARGVGREPGHADRVLDRARGRPRAQGRRRIHRQRPLAVLLRRRQFGLEHARRHGVRRRQAGRLAALRGAEVRLPDHRHLGRDGHGGDRQQGRRGERGVRAGPPRARARANVAAGSTIRAAALNRGALFGIPIVGASSHPLAPAAIGAAEGALRNVSRRDGEAGRDLYGRQGRGFPGGADQGRARAQPDRFRPRHLVRQSAIAFQDIAARDEVPDLATKLRFRAHVAFAVNQSREAVETLWSCYGAQGLYTRDPLQRHLRDVTGDGAALLVQLRHRGIGLRPARARRRVRQSDDVRRQGENGPRYRHLFGIY